MSLEIDLINLWQLAADGFALNAASFHGPEHWRSVERNAIELAKSTDANLAVVRLFAVLHDSKRMREDSDPGHGPRAAEWARALRGVHIHLRDDAFELLAAACEGHDRGQTSADPTIGTCWDADRLDLPRVGVLPKTKYFSTAEGKRLASSVQALW